MAAFLLALIIAPVAWPYRPLNQAERRLVGNWIGTGAQGDLGTVIFSPDRSWYRTMFMETPRRPGFRIQMREQQAEELTWSCSGTTLMQVQKPRLATDDLEALLLALLERIFDGDVRRSQVAFDGPDRVSIDGKSYERFDVRSPDVWRSPRRDIAPASPMSIGRSVETAPAP